MNFPSDKDRHAIVGTTGGGKTRAALWHLSRRNYTVKPWIIYNFKGEEDIDGIPYAYELDVTHVPLHPGIFVVRPLPHQTDEVEAQMWEVWRRGDMGIYVDEGYMVGANNRAYRALLTQGRSKRIPMINVSQRPVFMDKFVFTESEYWNIFELGSDQDEKKIKEYIRQVTDTTKLPRYHSYYFDKKEKKMVVMEPVPDLDEIYETFDRRLEKLRIRKVV